MSKQQTRGFFPLPPLPSELEDIVERRINEMDERGLGEVESQIDDYVEDLSEYAAKLKSDVVADLADLTSSGMSRALHADYFLSGLRWRIWELIFVCSRMNIPVRLPILCLLSELDRPAYKRSMQWFKALRTCAEEILKGKTPGANTLARLTQIPRTTLRGWMRDPEWRTELNREIDGLRHGFPQIDVRPMKLVRQSDGGKAS